jgi:hypothetical protein
MAKRLPAFLPFVAVVALLLSGCDAPTKPAQEASESTKPAATPTACALPVYDLEKLPIATATQLDSAAIFSLCQQSLGLKEAFADYYSGEKTYQLASVQCVGFTLLPLYRKGEDEMHRLYYLTFDAKQRLQSWALLATWGTAEEWHGISELQQAGNALRVITLNQMDYRADSEFMNDKTYKFTQDSVVEDFKLTPAGQLIKTRIDSTQRIVRTAAKR